MFFDSHADLFVPPAPVAAVVEPWRPQPLSHDQWPPSYRSAYAWRIQTLAALRADPAMLASCKAYYATRPRQFITDWCDTYDPRKSPNNVKPELRGSKWMPMVPFTKQASFIDFLHEMSTSGENGLIEKARDIGASWICCQYSVWCWLFIDGDSTGWGSRKQELVDKIGDVSSIFEKLRMIIRRLPDVFKPAGFKERDHLKSMNIVNPANGSTIIGEIGRNIGRGGRTSRYFKDESAHYEHPEDIQAALDDNTHVQIDISSVNGLGNVFHRRREAGITWVPGATIESGFVRVFIFDWSDHPEKTQEWYDRRKATAVREGMQHIFAQEVDRDYSASQANRIIDMAWIKAAIDAHLKVPALLRATADIPNTWGAGLDVADEGLDRNALAVRQWVIVRSVEEWGERDTGVTTRRTLAGVRSHKGIVVQYDNIGVGAGVKSEYNRLIETKEITQQQIKFVGWNAGAAVINPFDHIISDDNESLINKDFFANFKAQAWWSLRTRFYKTWRAVMEGVDYPAEDLIALDGRMPLLMSLCKELAQPVTKPSAGLRMLVDKTPPGTKSPNLADSVVMVMCPYPDNGGYPMIGSYSG